MNFKVPAELEPGFLSRVALNQKGPHLNQILRQIESDPSNLSSSSDLVKWLESQIDSQNQGNQDQGILSKDYALLLSCSSSTDWISKILAPDSERPTLRASSDYTIVKTALYLLFQKWNTKKSKGGDLDGLIDDLVSRATEEENGTEAKAAATLIAILQTLSLDNSSRFLKLISKFKPEGDDVRTRIVDQMLEMSLRESDLHLPKQAFPRLLMAASPSLLINILEAKDHVSLLLGMESKWWKMLAQKQFKVISSFILNLFQVKAITTTSPYEDPDFSKMMRADLIPILIKNDELMEKQVDGRSLRLTLGQQFFLQLLELSSIGETKTYESKAQAFDSLLESKGIVTFQRETPENIETSPMSQPPFIFATSGDDAISSWESKSDSVLKLASICLGRKMMHGMGSPTKRADSEEVIKTRIYLFDSILKSLENLFRGLDTSQLRLPLGRSKNSALVFAKAVSRCWGSESVRKLGFEREITSILKRLSRFLPHEAYCLSPKEHAYQSDSLLPDLLQVLPVSRRWDFVVALNEPHLSDSTSSISDTKLSKHLAHGSGSKYPLLILPLLQLHRKIARELLSEAREALGDGLNLVSENNWPSPFGFLIHAGMSYVPFGIDQSEAWESRRSVKKSTPSTERMTAAQEEMLKTFWDGLEVKSLTLKGQSAKERIDTLAALTRSRIEKFLNLRSSNSDVRSFFLQTAFSFVRLLDYGKIWEEFWPTLLQKTLRDATVPRLDVPCEFFSGEKGWNGIYSSKEGQLNRLQLVEAAAASGDVCMKKELDYLWKRRREPDFNAQAEIRSFLSSLDKILRRRIDLITALCASLSSKEQEDLASSLVPLLLEPLLNIRLRFMKEVHASGNLVFSVTNSMELSILKSTALVFGKFLDRTAIKMKEAAQEILLQNEAPPRWLSKSEIELDSKALFPFHERSLSFRDVPSRIKKSGLKGVSLRDSSPELFKRVVAILFERDGLLGEDGDLDPEKVFEWEQAWRIYLNWSRDSQERLRKLEILADLYGVEEDSSRRFLRILRSDSPDASSIIVKSNSSPLFQRFFAQDQSNDGHGFDLFSNWRGPLHSSGDDQLEDESDLLISSLQPARLSKPQRSPSPFVSLMKLFFKACSTRENLRHLSRNQLLGFVRLLRARSCQESKSTNDAIIVELQGQKALLLEHEVREGVKQPLGKLSQQTLDATRDGQGKDEGTWIGSIRLGVNMGFLSSTEILDSIQVVQKVEQTQLTILPPPDARSHEDSNLLSSLQVDYLLPLGRALILSERPVLALPLARSILKNTELSSWHRRLPFLISLRSKLPKQDRSSWMNGIKEEVFELGKEQNSRTSQEKMKRPPILKISTIKALFQFMDSFSSGGVISVPKNVENIVSILREFPNQDVRVLCLRSLLGSLVQSASSILPASSMDLIAAFYGDESKASKLKIKFQSEFKESYLKEILRFLSTIEDSSLNRNPNFASQTMEGILIPCLFQVRKTERLKIEKAFETFKMDSKDLNPSIDLVVNHSTLLDPESLAAIQKFLPFIFDSESQGTNFIKRKFPEILVNEDFSEAFEKISEKFIGLKGGQQEIRSLRSSLNVFSPRLTGSGKPSNSLLISLCELIGTSGRKESPSIESIERIILSRTDSCLSKEVPESKTWEQVRIEKRPRAFGTLFLLLKELGKSQFVDLGGIQAMEIWLNHYRPILGKIRSKLISSIPTCSPSNKPVLLTLISISSNEIIPYSILSAPSSTPDSKRKKTLKISDEISKMLREMLGNFKNLAVACNLLSDSDFGFNECKIGDLDDRIQVLEELLKMSKQDAGSVSISKSMDQDQEPDQGGKQGVKMEGMEFLIHNFIHCCISNHRYRGDEKEKLTKFKGSIMERERGNLDVAIGFLWQGQGRQNE